MWKKKSRKARGQENMQFNLWDQNQIMRQKAKIGKIKKMAVIRKTKVKSSK